MVSCSIAAARTQDETSAAIIPHVHEILKLDHDEEEIKTTNRIDLNKFWASKFFRSHINDEKLKKSSPKAPVSGV